MFDKTDVVPARDRRRVIPRGIRNNDLRRYTVIRHHSFDLLKTDLECPFLVSTRQNDADARE